VIQLAILLDTSGSMEGLINQARSRIWDVVNDLTKARRDGHRARLEVALYEYGSDRLPSSEGFLTLTQPFTTDLDLLSERLFSLRVGGSSEYCGWALRSATRELNWDNTSVDAPKHTQPLRVVVIAGNESFTQGPVDWRDAARCGPDRGLVVNTVYCGPQSDGRESGWYDAARLGRGAYLSIDQDARIPRVICPMDDEILGLNNKLNSTYLAYGEKGEQFKDRQRAQDSANRELSTDGAVSRAAAKASPSYSNSHWDLLDAVKQKKVDLDTAPTESLPGVLRSMTIDERRAEVTRLETEREELQKRIRTLAAERKEWIRDHNRGRNQGGDTLDAAMIRAIREQARRLGFAFEVD